MELKDLKSGQGKVDVVVSVKSKDEPKTMVKFGRELSICNAVVSDNSGEMKLTLWNDEILKVSVGDKIHITNGYIKEFQGEKQLTAGKFGKLEVLDKDGEGSEGGEKGGADAVVEGSESAVNEDSDNDDAGEGSKGGDFGEKEI